MLPGLALAGAVSLGALALERIETYATGRPWLEALVLAILIGTAIRTGWRIPARFDSGIQCAAKTLLEVAIVLMGATISFGAILAVGWPLLLGIAATVVLAIGASFLLGRALGLTREVALLVACGNAICGNSAIAAVAPAIDADADDVATAIAFTAVLGVGVVLCLPLAAAGLHLSAAAGGVLAGLTVYAVPQVIAATAPLGAVAIQLGTLVKLVRVLTLGPVVTCLSLLQRRREGADRRGTNGLLLPGFILAFLALAAARSLALLPDALVPPAQGAGNFLTVMAMAGLGLGVDLRHVAAAGPRVTLAVTLSLLILAGIALLVLRLIGLA
ncbi:MULTISPECIES: putative sulfate exporter family transporter [unclassified Sphingomonas]|jgi:uncharacterized integral membrane protein (TIGR00698 family)|uniref:YeiH family protein n=1 Tax=unclassified Sphingomonas TaxID=196159 RepID=UPI000A584697|nr:MULTISPECIES: putative sulfate exporter family transporter [unclassified Sphingomonas]